MIGITFGMGLLLSIAMISTALLAISPNRSTAIAILAAGAVGLFAYIMFLLLAAPHVAMTEAAIEEAHRAVHSLKI